MSFIVSLLITLISVLVFLTGGGVVSERNRLAIRGIALLIGGIAAFASVSKLFAVVPAGNVGVVDSLGQVSETSLNPGVHFVSPFTKIVIFSTRLRNVQETIEATSQEGLAFNTNVSLQYRLEPQKAASIYKSIGIDETEIVVARFRSIVREITANYPAEAIYSRKRLEIANQIRQRLSKQLTPLGFIVEEALLRELQIPEKIQSAIQEKLQAEQESQRMTFVLKKERQEADRKRIEAKGISDSQKIISQGLNDKILQLRSIEATEKLASSSNSKVIMLGAGKGGMPMLLQQDTQTSKP
ncbi:prohibitin family protein [Argonema antarcticum]|uniref:prohibitin family protein n=1 Tax=Argonema antarcticum TaxID=2942763 RepID=UPI00201195FB|nr:prohibitin family protein [Argonema antarcticum]MCL1474130.1 prohibitin family protein [Argonema antarcticum A004/B2]